MARYTKDYKGKYLVQLVDGYKYFTNKMNAIVYVKGVGFGKVYVHQYGDCYAHWLTIAYGAIVYKDKTVAKL